MKFTVANHGKQYSRDFWGLKDFFLEIKPGILGLLKPNGAGKPKFMWMPATITKPSDEKILWNDVELPNHQTQCEPCLDICHKASGHTSRMLVMLF
jgi:ABC-type multidrug transport system ATPase subunit